MKTKWLSIINVTHVGSWEVEISFKLASNRFVGKVALVQKRAGSSFRFTDIPSNWRPIRKRCGVFRDRFRMNSLAVTGAIAYRTQKALLTLSFRPYVVIGTNNKALWIGSFAICATDEFLWDPKARGELTSLVTAA